MGNGRGRVPTYHCRIESVALGELEVTGGGAGRVVGGVGGNTKKGPVVRTVETPVKAKQPWKTLGIDAPEEREH